MAEIGYDLLEGSGLVSIDVHKFVEEDKRGGVTVEMIGQYGIVLRVWPIPDEYLAADVARLVAQMWKAHFKLTHGDLVIPDPDLKEPPHG